MAINGNGFHRFTAAYFLLIPFQDTEDYNEDNKKNDEENGPNERPNGLLAECVLMWSQQKRTNDISILFHQRAPMNVKSSASNPSRFLLQTQVGIPPSGQYGVHYLTGSPRIEPSPHTTALIR